jgi:hypothetical protein
MLCGTWFVFILREVNLLVQRTVFLAFVLRVQKQKDAVTFTSTNSRNSGCTRVKFG